MPAGDGTLEGTLRVYAVSPDGMGALRSWMDEFWSQALEGFRTAAERPGTQGGLSHGSGDLGNGQQERDGDLVIRKSVTVPLSRGRIQAVHRGNEYLVANAHPLGRRRGGAGRMDAQVGGEIYEELRTEGDVGTITAWDAPETFSSTWHPGYGAELATQLTVRFAEVRPPPGSSSSIAAGRSTESRPGAIRGLHERLGSGAGPVRGTRGG